MLPLGLLAAGAGAIIKGIKAGHQNHLANGVVVPEANYTVSPYAENTLALAKQMFNGKMPGAENATAQIKGNEANTFDQIDRNSTSGSQSLAMIAASQGITDNSLNELAGKEEAYKAGAFNNLNAANYGMTNELDKVYQDKVRKQDQALQEKTALRGAANANFGNALTDLTTGAFMFDQMKKK